MYVCNSNTNNNDSSNSSNRSSNSRGCAAFRFKLDEREGAEDLFVVYDYD